MPDTVIHRASRDTIAHRTARRLSPGRFYPLGATPEGDGVNFALYSRHATDVWLLLFDTPDGEPTDVIRVDQRDRFVWHVFVHSASPGQLYGYRVSGPHGPGQGMRFNENKVLLDPYARAVSGKFRNEDNLLLAHDPGSPERDLSMDTRDNARLVPKGIVVDDRFDWAGDRHPDIPLEQLVIYEVHVKGFTAHGSSAVKNPGTYLGFVEKIPHLKELGVNAVELLPMQEFVVDDFLVERGLTNYWGYNTIGFFAPESSFSSGRRRGCQVSEFKTLVRALHSAGIEVILDVVYNHTAEGNEMGPMLSFKGIDNPAYYCLTGGADAPGRYYVNDTGCGNSLQLADPAVIRLVMDSLRYWVEVMHVDGFRFDLASVLGRQLGRFDRSASFFDAVQQDPVLGRVKLIAEPWDLGTYQVGNFPVDWSEWNGRFRDTVRRFTRGDASQLREMGWRLSGSADLYADDGRSAYNSVNFVTCHDGFTMNDLVSYDRKHNEANKEGNRDGCDDNMSWNCGVEGATGDPAVEGLRRQQAKNMLCTLILSSGTPMLLGGDEFLRTQRGNNNAYCQDNELSWFDWRLAEGNAEFVAFTRKAIALRRQHKVLQRRKFFSGQDHSGDAIPDIAWFGRDLDPPGWEDSQSRTLCFMLDGAEAASEAGDYLLFVILNADASLQHVRLPAPGGNRAWYRVVDTSLPGGDDFLEPGEEIRLSPGDSYLANARSTVVLLAR